MLPDLPPPLNMLSVKFAKEMCGTWQSFLRLFCGFHENLPLKPQCELLLDYCAGILLSAAHYVCNQFFTSNTQIAFESFSVAMVTPLLYLVLSVIHLAVKKWTKEKKAGALSLLYSQLSGRHTLLIYLFFVAHKRDLLKMFGKKIWSIRSIGLFCNQ